MKNKSICDDCDTQATCRIPTQFERLEAVLKKYVESLNHPKEVTEVRFVKNGVKGGLDNYCGSVSYAGITVFTFGNVQVDYKESEGRPVDYFPIDLENWVSSVEWRLEIPTGDYPSMSAGSFAMDIEEETEWADGWDEAEEEEEELEEETAVNVAEIVRQRAVMETKAEILDALLSNRK